VRTKPNNNPKNLIMRTLNSIFGKNSSVDVFNSFRGESLTEMEMNYVRGGGDPPYTPPPIDPIDVFIPLP
jgi:hypothetical protein